MARRKCIVGGDLSHGTQSNVDGDDTVLFLRGVRCGSGTTRFCSKYCTAGVEDVREKYRKCNLKRNAPHVRVRT